MRKEWKAGVIIILAVLLPYGCKGQHSALNGFKPETNCIFIGKDGLIASGMVENFSAENQENYQQEKLQAFVLEEVASFNESLGAAKAPQNEEGKEMLPVAVISCELKDKKVTAVYQYKDSTSFLEFNRSYSGLSGRLENFAVNSIQEARKQGWLFGDFVKPGKNGEEKALEEQELERLDKGQVIWIETGQPVEVQVEGAVRYMTEGMTVIKKNTVQVPAGVHYIIFW